MVNLHHRAMMSKLMLVFCVLVQLFCVCRASAVPMVESSINGDDCDSSDNSTPKSCLCYSVLESSLLATEKNRVNLMKTFFPPEANTPEFVKVTYRFEDNTNTSVWFWSAKTSHFLHPFIVFQFMSLLFSKPEPYYTGMLEVTLKMECMVNLSPDKSNLQLLTQRLLLYAERGNAKTANLVLREMYNAKAYEIELLNKLFDDSSNRITAIIISTGLLVFTFSVLIFILMCCTFCVTTSHSNSEWVKKVSKNGPAVASLAVVSFILNIYIICLASSAIGFWRDRVMNDADLNALFADCDGMRINLSPMIIALFFDILCFLAYLILVLTSVFMHFNVWCKPYKSYAVVVLSLTVFCPMFCIIAHSPYIAVAYLNDGDHASSIFVYYTILVYMFFGLLWLFFRWCQHKPKTTVENAVANHFDGLSQMLQMLENLCDNVEKGIAIVSALLATFILLGLVVLIACYLVLIPINRAISDAPNRILSIYQSGGFLIGSFIVFKVLEYFYTKKPEDEEKTLKDVCNKMDNLFGNSKWKKSDSAA